jgi:hypothetical protein
LTKGAVQLHLLLDHDGYLPSYAVITEGKKHEVRVARQMRCAPGTILVFDRGYTDYEWFASLIQQGVAHANEHRDWRIYADFAHILIATARDLYRDEPFGVELSETVYALDSTTIDLCLALFPWGKFRRHKSAVKLHTLLDLRGSIPTNVYVTGGRVHDVNILDQLLPEAGAFYLLDRGYVDFARLYLFTQACAFFITRARKDVQFYRRYSRPVERSVGLRCDQIILLTGVRTAKRYPDPLRRIHYFDIEKDLRLTFLTNNFLLSALTIAQLYRARWQVELFFRWIKQHLRIKAFYGTSENAVKTQVWVASPFTCWWRLSKSNWGWS